MVVRWLAALLAAAAVAAGCSSGTKTGSSVPQTSAPAGSREARASTTTTTTSPPTTAGAVGTAEDLRAQLLTHGLCDETTTFTPLLPVTVTGLLNCEDGYLIVSIPGQTERDTVLLYLANQACTATTYLAVAPTWIVLPIPATETRAGQVADILGGEVRGVPCDRD